MAKHTVYFGNLSDWVILETLVTKITLVTSDVGDVGDFSSLGGKLDALAKYMYFIM